MMAIDLSCKEANNAYDDDDDDEKAVFESIETNRILSILQQRLNMELENFILPSQNVLPLEKPQDFLLYTRISILKHKILEDFRILINNYKTLENLTLPKITDVKTIHEGTE